MKKILVTWFVRKNFRLSSHFLWYLWGIKLCLSLRKLSSKTNRISLFTSPNSKFFCFFIAVIIDLILHIKIPCLYRSFQAWSFWMINSLHFYFIIALFIFVKVKMNSMIHMIIFLYHQNSSSVQSPFFFIGYTSRRRFCRHFFFWKWSFRI